MKKLLHKLWDNRELLLAIVLCLGIIYLYAFWLLPKTIVTSVHTSGDISKISEEDR